MNYTQIKEMRKVYKISQIKLAEISGYSPAKISSWELGKSRPGEADLSRLCESLNKIIFNIETGKFDIRKKRIIRSNTKKALPQIIKTATEYKKMLSNRILKSECPYRDYLTTLYESAVTSKKNTAPKVIALFSGCGGLSLGFAASGFKLVGHVDIEDSANKIYSANFQDSCLLGTDICALSDDEINSWKKFYGSIDVLIGGPPCQGFSLAGKRDPEDIRNQLYKYYAHIVDLIRPKIFVMENVSLLTSMKTKSGSFFIDEIQKSFHLLGYTITINMVNAQDYGVPQSRERVILVGSRNDLLQGKFEFPRGKYTREAKEKGYFKWRTFRDATLDLQPLESGEHSSDPLHWAISHPAHVIKWLKDVPEGCSAHDNADPSLRPPSGFNTTYKRIRWDEPCSTISTNFSMISGCRNVHPSSTRSLTIREAARAQSFPDEFIFIGKWGEIRKAIGNAVPPILAKNIADAIKIQYFDD